MDGNVSRIPSVGKPNYAVERSGKQSQSRKQDQPPFSLEEKEQGKEKEKSGAEAKAPSGTPGASGTAEELEIAPPKDGEAGTKLNVVA